MALTVVLIRHGEAKSKRLGETDFDRELTKRGAKALERAFPEYLRMVDTSLASELWMSPAVRARQTAEIANKTLHIETHREIPALYEQDQKAFLDQLGQTNADVVVAVGHIPFMEDVAARLCGTYLGFSTGAAAAIEIDDATGRGTLKWFVQGPRS